MARRVWIASGAALVLAALLVAGSAALSRTLAQLRTGHARPAAYVPDGAIAVTAMGKTFHRPQCSFIHGPARAISPAEAIREGYTPCIRCLKKLALGGAGAGR